MQDKNKELVRLISEVSIRTYLDCLAAYDLHSKPLKERINFAIDKVLEQIKITSQPVQGELSYDD